MRWGESRAAHWLVPALLLVAAACGDQSEPLAAPAVTFDVRSASTTATSVDAEGVVVSRIDLIVQEGTQRIEGARLRYAVSAGSLSVPTGTSGEGGVASVTWTLTPDQYAGQEKVTFSVCAGNQDPPSCSLSVLLTMNPSLGP
jgi:hypothetical protein